MFYPLALHPRQDVVAHARNKRSSSAGALVKRSRGRSTSSSARRRAGGGGGGRSRARARARGRVRGVSAAPGATGAPRAPSPITQRRIIRVGRSSMAAPHQAGGTTSSSSRTARRTKISQPAPSSVTPSASPAASTTSRHDVARTIRSRIRRRSTSRPRRPRSAGRVRY